MCRAVRAWDMCVCVLRAVRAWDVCVCVLWARRSARHEASRLMRGEGPRPRARRRPRGMRHVWRSGLDRARRQGYKVGAQALLEWGQRGSGLELMWLGLRGQCYGSSVRVAAKGSG